MTSYFDETGLADIFLEEEAPPRRTSSSAPRAASSPIWRAREADVWAAAKAAPEPRTPVLSVSELLGRLERSIERAAEGCWVRGEVTDLRVSAAGHQYFRLKDSGGVLSCVLFRGRSAGRRLETGASIEAFGRMDVYPVFPGVTASFQSFLASRAVFHHDASATTLDMHHCRMGL